MSSCLNIELAQFQILHILSFSQLRSFPKSTLHYLALLEEIASLPRSFSIPHDHFTSISFWKYPETSRDCTFSPAIASTLSKPQPGSAAQDNGSSIERICSSSKQPHLKTGLEIRLRQRNSSYSSASRCRTLTCFLSCRGSFLPTTAIQSFARAFNHIPSYLYLVQSGSSPNNSNRSISLASILVHSYSIALTSNSPNSLSVHFS